MTDKSSMTTLEKEQAEEKLGKFEAWLVRKLKPTIAHELGHYIAIQLIGKETPEKSYGRLTYAVTRNADYIDPDTGETGEVWSYHGSSGKIRSEPGVYTPEEDRLISASGVATELLLTPPEKRFESENTWSGSEGDRNHFRDKDEFGAYITKARAFLEPYIETVSVVAERMATEVAKEYGAGEHSIKISGEDINKYLEV